jgi:hypothetical protein
VRCFVCGTDWIIKCCLHEFRFKTVRKTRLQHAVAVRKPGHSGFVALARNCDSLQLFQFKQSQRAEQSANSHSLSHRHTPGQYIREQGLTQLTALGTVPNPAGTLVRQTRCPHEHLMWHTAWSFPAERMKNHENVQTDSTYIWYFRILPKNCPYILIFI